MYAYFWLLNNSLHLESRGNFLKSKIIQETGEHVASD